MNYAPTNVKPELGLDQLDLGSFEYLKVKLPFLGPKRINRIKFLLFGDFN